MKQRGREIAIPLRGWTIRRVISRASSVAESPASIMDPCVLFEKEKERGMNATLRISGDLLGKKSNFDRESIHPSLSKTPKSHRKVNEKRDATRSRCRLANRNLSSAYRSIARGKVERTVSAFESTRRERTFEMRAAGFRELTRSIYSSTIETAMIGNAPICSCSRTIASIAVGKRERERERESTGVEQSGAREPCIALPLRLVEEAIIS